MPKRNRTVKPALKPTASPRRLDLGACLVRAPDRRPTGPVVLVESQRRYGGCAPGLDFSLLRLGPNAARLEVTTSEVLYVLLSGSVAVEADGQRFEGRRSSLFDEGPSALHCGPRVQVRLQAGAGGAELAVARTANPRYHGVRWTEPTDVTLEDRGAGLAQGACRRTVRTLFDLNSRPDSAFVAGEVVNLPGRWSSYPPHHHAQPEIYHYRFTDRRGYGHAELGDAVVKVRDGDTVVIPGGLDHAQVSAPGYGMYYLWIVRHLPRAPYRGFTYNPAHRWLLDPNQQGWLPSLP